MSENGNGHTMNGNGRAAQGAKGGAAPRMRRGMQLISDLVDAGKQTPSQMASNLEWARAMRDNEGANERTRLRASELVAKLELAIVAAGLDLEKLERLDAGEATDRTETRDVTVTVPRVGRLSE